MLRKGKYVYVCACACACACVCVCVRRREKCCTPRWVDRMHIYLFIYSCVLIVQFIHTYLFILWFVDVNHIHLDSLKMGGTKKYQRAFCLALNKNQHLSYLHIVYMKKKECVSMYVSWCVVCILCVLFVFIYLMWVVQHTSSHTYSVQHTSSHTYSVQHTSSHTYSCLYFVCVIHVHLFDVSRENHQKKKVSPTCVALVVEQRTTLTVSSCCVCKRERKSVCVWGWGGR